MRERRKSNTLNSKRQRALTALLRYSTKRAAAEAAGIDEKTLRGYLGEAEFLSEYRRAFAALVENATRTAQQALAPAIQTLRAICEDKSAPATARIAAAKAILENGLRMTETIDILERLERLENAETQDTKEL